MSVHVFGQIDDAPVVRGRRSPRRRGRRAKILNWGAVLRDLVVPLGAGPAAGDARPQLDRGLSRAFPAVSARCPDASPTASPTAVSRSTAPSTSWRASPGKSTRCTADRTASAGELWKFGRHRRVLGRRSISNRPTATPGFPGALTATCVYRLLEPATLRVELTATVRPADDRQPHPARLFQSRRIERRARPRTDAGVRLLHADRRRADPDRRNPLGRGHAVRLSPGAADPQFRRARPTTSISSPRASPDATGLAPIAQAALAAQRPDDGAAQHASRACRSTTRPSSIARRRASTARVTARTPASAWSRRLPGFAQSAPFHPLRAAARRRISPRQRIPLRLSDVCRRGRRPRPSSRSTRLFLREALAGAGFGERLADLEAEIVHRGFLAHVEVLALGLALRLLGRARDVDRDVRLDLRDGDGPASCAGRAS